MAEPTELTDDSYLQPTVAAELTSLADLLDAASDAQWDTPSLCAGWRVREVVAHMTMAARYPEEQFMAELQRCGFDFTRLSNEIAARDASLPADELIKNLRSEVMRHWAPPGGGYRGALNHAVIHGLDVTVPLGAPASPRTQTIRVILDDLTEGDVHRPLRHRLRGPATAGDRPGLVVRRGPGAARRRRRPGAGHLRSLGPARTARRRPARIAQPAD